MKPVTQHVTVNVAWMGQHSIFWETYNFVFFQSWKGKSYPICHDGGKERPKYLAPSITRSHTNNFFLSAFTVWRTQSCKFSTIWGTASLLVRHPMTGFVGTGPEDEPPGSLNLTIAKFFVWGYVTRDVLGRNGQVPPQTNLCSISLQQLEANFCILGAWWVAISHLQDICHIKWKFTDRNLPNWSWLPSSFS